MNTQQVSIEYEEAGTFTEKNWNELIERISILFQFTIDDKKKLSANKMAKLVAAIPYLALCKEPKRTALSHLSILFLAAHESGKDVFVHNFSDNSSLLNRLERISHFDGGNQNIINRGMNLLCIIMLSDHIKDSIEDKSNKKYNPVESLVWNAQRQIEILEKKINGTDCDSMEKIISVNEAKANWWHYP